MKPIEKVFLPIANFTKQTCWFSTIPICLAENATDFQLIDTVAKLISNKVFAINSQQRRVVMLLFF
jgi:hypothetical protein